MRPCFFLLCVVGPVVFLSAADMPDPRAVRQIATKVVDWQIDTFADAAKYRAITDQRLKMRYTRHYRTPVNHHELDWTNAVLYAGIDEFRGIAENRRKYTDWLVAIGDRNGWRPYYRPYYADDHAVGIAFLSLYEDLGDPAMRRELHNAFDYILRYPKTGSLDYVRREGAWIFETDVLNRWGWSDALFMGPPVWARMAKVTGDARYLEFMDQEWHATYDLLWSFEHKLFYRDTRFFTRTEENGQPIGSGPTQALPDKTEVYAVGAFLLAATEVYKLAGGK